MIFKLLYNSVDCSFALSERSSNRSEIFGGKSFLFSNCNSYISGRVKIFMNERPYMNYEK